MERDNATKKKIRQVALSLFNEKSFEETTLSEICEKSGVNKNTFYYYFRSKDDLLEPYYSIPYRLETRDMSTIMEADSYVEQFWLVSIPMIEFVERSGMTILRQIFIKSMTDEKRTLSASQEKKDMMRLQRKIIEKGKAAGEFRTSANSNFLVMQFYQQILSAALIWSIHQGTYCFRDYLRYSYENLFDVEPSLRTLPDWTMEEWRFLDE